MTDAQQQEMQNVYRRLTLACNAGRHSEACEALKDLRSLWAQCTDRSFKEFDKSIGFSARTVQLWMSGGSFNGLKRALDRIGNLIDLSPDMFKMANYPTLAEFIQNIEHGIGREVPLGCFSECDVLRRKLYEIE